MSWIRRETEKETVQYICPHCHDYHEFREDFGERTFSENYIFCRRCGARNGTDNAPTLTQPNEPLTLDELREMDGEPVWGKSLITEKLGEWFILRVVEMSKTWFIACAGAAQGFGDKDTYGKTWLAYRRPPEGEEEEKHVIEITENL